MEIPSNGHFSIANKDLGQQIETWVKETLSAPQSVFNDMAPCPYAREALVKNEILILSAQDQFTISLNYIADHFNSYQKRVVILACPSEAMNIEETQRIVKNFREQYSNKNIWLMYDHPLVAEKVESVDFTYGKALLFFMQKLDDLTERAEDLVKTGYYKNWPEQYFQKVFQIRKELHLKNQEK